MFIERERERAGFGESRAGKGFMIRCEGDNHKQKEAGEMEAGLCWAHAQLVEGQTGIFCAAPQC